MLSWETDFIWAIIARKQSFLLFLVSAGILIIYIYNVSDKTQHHPLASQPGSLINYLIMQEWFAIKAEDPETLSWSLKQTSLLIWHVYRFPSIFYYEFSIRKSSSVNFSIQIFNKVRRTQLLLELSKGEERRWQNRQNFLSEPLGYSHSDSI